MPPLTPGSTPPLPPSQACPSCPPPPLAPPRPGTPAARMKRVATQVVKERTRQLTLVGGLWA